MRQQIPLLGDQSVNRQIRINDQQTINFEPIIEKPNARTTLSLVSTPGLTVLGTSGDGATRSNFIKFNGYTYYVNGSKLIQIDSGNAATVIGTLNTSSGWCILAAGRSYLMIVDGKDGYTYDGATFAEITDADFPSNPSHCSYLNDRFITNKGFSDEFYISAVEDPTSWAALDFASAEANPDNILAHASTNRDLYLIGENTAQPFYSSGNADFPYDPYQQVIEVGIAAKYSLAKGAAGLFWLASNDEGDAFVVKVVGFQATVISDPEMNWQINQLVDVTDAVGSLFRHNGRTWYELTFTSSDITYVFDVDTGSAHRRKSYNMGRHRASGFGYFNNKVLCGDYTNNNFYELSYDTYTDNGDIIERIRRTQVIHVNQQDMIFHELVLDMQTGVGISGGDEPFMQMRYSDDGYTWSNWLSSSIGKIGEYSVRAHWNKLGVSNNRTFEFRQTYPVATNIFNAYMDIETLPW